MRLFLSVIASLTLAAPAFAAVPAPADTSKSDMLTVFRGSDIGTRLAALGTTVTDCLSLNDHEVIVAEYVPPQSSASDWDNETRLVLYKWDTLGQFEREQFVTKAGDSIPGRLGGLVVQDLDGDGQPEILAIGQPFGPTARVSSMVFRRPGPTQRFERIWNRRDPGAAFSIQGAGLFYTYQEHMAPHTRRFEHDRLADGQFQKE